MTLFNFLLAKVLCRMPELSEYQYWKDTLPFVVPTAVIYFIISSWFVFAS